MDLPSVIFGTIATLVSVLVGFTMGLAAGHNSSKSATDEKKTESE